MLEVFLGQCYAAEFLGKGKYSDALRALRSRLSDGSQLKKEAQQMAAKLDKVKDRCFISRKYVQYINKALTAQE